VGRCYFQRRFGDREGVEGAKTKKKGRGDCLRFFGERVKEGGDST